MSVSLLLLHRTPVNRLVAQGWKVPCVCIIGVFVNFQYETNYP